MKKMKTFKPKSAQVKAPKPPKNPFARKPSPRGGGMPRMPGSGAY